MASCSTEPPTGSAWIQEKDEEKKESKSLQRSSSDEFDESEPEPPLASVVRRKVSFADAFGLDLVSVKEFDNRVESAERRERDEFYLSCIFSVPASDEELEFRLGKNKLELERIELLPGSSTIRATVRVLNLSYHKVVYVRITLDGWQSHFDQLAEYVPGSSNGETDRFSFQLTLMPPFPPEGLRVEFCLCYESSTGIFWANNGGMNYVLFCHQRGGRTVKEEEKERESEENNQKGKKSCLKTSIKWSCAESKATDMSSDLSEQETSRSVEDKKEKTQHEAENRSNNVLEESCKTLAERRNRRQAAQLAPLQDYFSHRDTEVQLVQPLHAEKSKTDVNVLLPIPQSSIPVMTNISCTLQECKILPDHENTLPPVDWGRNISSPSPSNTNISEIISATRMNVPEKEKTEDVSKELSNDAWKDFLNGTYSLDNQKHNNALDQKCLLCTVGSNASQPSDEEYHVSNIGDKIISVWNCKDCAVSAENMSHQCFRAMESLESDPAKPSPTLDRSHFDEVLSYKYPEKGQISSEPHTVQKSESVWVQWRPGATEALHDRHLLSERPSSKDEAMLLPEQGDTAHAKDATERSNSKPEDKVLFEECTSCTVFVDMKVKGDTHRVVKDTLTLTRIGNKPFIESKESLETQQTDDSGEPIKKKEHIEFENENGSHIKWMSWSEYSDEASVVQENKLQEDDKEPSHLKDGNTEIWISSETSMVNDKAEPHKQAEYFDKEEDAAVCYGLVKAGSSDSSEKQRGEMFVENSECKNGLKTEDQGIYVTQSKGEEDIDKELHKFQNSPETCLHLPNLCTGSNTSSPSGHFTCTASLSEGKLFSPAPYKGLKSEETLRYRVAQDLQDQGVGTEIPSSFSRTATPSVSKLSSWLLICWAKISNLSSITGAIVCAILFVIFVTAYLHDLPVCFAIYLLPVCWWFRQGMKKDVTTADSVD